VTSKWLMPTFLTFPQYPKKILKKVNLDYFFLLHITNKAYIKNGSKVRFTTGTPTDSLHIQSVLSRVY
jgi:hypothetical protein